MTITNEQDEPQLTREALEALREKYRALEEPDLESRYDSLRKENQKLRERLWELEEDRFNRLSRHPNLKRITTNEKDGGFTFWF